VGRKLTEVLDDLPPDRRQRIADERDALLDEIATLKQLREHAAVGSQGEVAGRMGVSQAAVSKTENRHPRHLSLRALDRYVDAVGGHLDVTITIPGHAPVRLSRLSDVADDDGGAEHGDDDARQ